MNERGERKARTPVAIRRCALTSFATRQFDVHGPKKRKKSPLFVLILPYHHFEPTTHL